MPASTVAMVPVLMRWFTKESISVVFFSLAVSRVAASVDGGTIGLTIPRLSILAGGDGTGVRDFLARTTVHLAKIQITLLILGSALLAVGLRFPHTDSLLQCLVLWSACVAASYSFQLMTLSSSALYASGSYPRLLLAASAASITYVVLISMATIVGLRTPVVVLGATFVQYSMCAILNLGGGLPSGPSGLPPAPAVGIRGSKVMQFISLAGGLVLQAPVLTASLVLPASEAVVAGLAAQYGTALKLALASVASYLLAAVSRPHQTRSAIRRLNTRWMLVSGLAGIAGVALAPIALRVWLGGADWSTTYSTAHASVSAALVVSTLVVSSAQRAAGLLIPEAMFVASLLAGAVVVAVVAAPTGLSTILWTATTISTFVSVVTLHVFGRRRWASSALERLRRFDADKLGYTS